MSDEERYQGPEAPQTQPPDRMIVGLDTFAQLVSDCGGLGDETAWQTAIDLANTGAYGFTQHEQELLGQRIALRNEVGELISSEHEREGRLVDLVEKYPDADAEDVAEAQEMLRACRVGRVRLYEILMEHEAAITRLRATVVDHWRAAEATRVISKALGTPIMMLHLTSQRERRRQSRRHAGASASKGDSSDSPARPRAPGDDQERLEQRIDRLLHEIEAERAERRTLLDELRAHGARLAARAWRERRAA